VNVFFPPRKIIAHRDSTGDHWGANSGPDKWWWWSKLNIL